MDNTFATLIVLIVGLGVGGFIGWTLARSRFGEEIASLKGSLLAKDAEAAAHGSAMDAMRAEIKTLAYEAADTGRKALLEASDERMGEARRDLAHNREIMGEMVKPLSEGIERFDKAFIAGKTALEEQVRVLAEQSERASAEAGKLAAALSSSEGRGRWGEMQLQRVVELAGMTEYCDYEVEVSAKNAAGVTERADMVIHMPNERVVVVDAKAPMRAYMESLDAETSEDRDAALRGVAKQVRERSTELAKKSYEKTFGDSPDFIVMFLPGEFILPIALSEDPELLSAMLERGVIIATPMTLMALLRTIHKGWSEVRLSRQASEIAEAGGELFDSIRVFAGHMDGVRKGLSSAEGAYNKAVGSLERNVLSKARKLKGYGVETSREIGEAESLDGQMRKLRGYEERQAALGETDELAAD